MIPEKKSDKKSKDANEEISTLQKIIERDKQKLDFDDEECGVSSCTPETDPATYCVPDDAVYIAPEDLNIQSTEALADEQAIKEKCDEGKREKRTITKCLCVKICSVSIFLVVASVVVMSIMFFGRERMHQSSRTNVSIQYLSSSSPSPQPSSERYLEFKDAILSLNISDPVNLNDQGSPQHDALVWLAYEDLETSIYAENLVQRYVLAVFYFAMRGDEWMLCSRDSNCRCTGQMACSDFDRERHVPQLSKGSECNWYGYECDDDNRLKRIRFGTGSGNNLKGQIPSEIGHLDRLQSLILANNIDITGTIPNIFHNFSDLSFLVLKGSKLTGSIPESLFDSCPLLSVVDFRSNQLTGHISHKINHLTNLRLIHLSRNNFNGLIPSEIGDLTDLGSIAIAHNNLNGTLPREIFQMEKLVTLDLRQNHLNGKFPEHINLPSLTNISIADNEIHGKLPEDLFENSKDLRVLDFAMNRLSGTITSKIGELPKLSFLTLHGNNFTGLVPTTLCSNDLSARITIDCADQSIFCAPECCRCVD